MFKTCLKQPVLNMRTLIFEDQSETKLLLALIRKRITIQKAIYDIIIEEKIAIRYFQPRKYACLLLENISLFVT